ncbi:hypothetical protein [Phytohabitans houttuyneae]|jgi:hypothetical protein|uniref:Uncharacterized protein n=1 Tax=Phytohabitans houttuyneae TaxID=1076126 RepID=A0A6V8KI65_9ACTN|nr:hypothetical protein [Phytohabitans houttuyneae]GFJ82151.1 hypothetical protein Phou_063310 [Phytohabitans houttuyneae]
MTTDSSARTVRVRAGAVAAMTMTVFGACLTALLLAAATWWTASFAADGELRGSAWAAVAGLVMYALISGLATWYIGRRGVQELRRVRGR